MFGHKTFYIVFQIKTQHHQKLTCQTKSVSTSHNKDEGLDFGRLGGQQCSPKNIEEDEEGYICGSVKRKYTLFKKLQSCKQHRLACCCNSSDLALL